MEFCYSISFLKNKMERWKSMYVYTWLNFVISTQTISWFCLSPVQARSDLKEDIFSARKCEATHWMIKSKFLFSLTQQLLKRRLVQVRYGNHKTLLLVFSYIHCYTSLWDVHTPLKPTEAETHYAWSLFGVKTVISKELNRKCLMLRERLDLNCLGLTMSLCIYIYG